MAIPFAVAALIALVVTIVSGSPVGLLAVGLILLFVIPSARKTSFVFDSKWRVVRWTRRKLFKAESGKIPFEDIIEIDTEATFGDRTPSYRLKIMTPQGSIPMAYTYGGGSRHYEQLREAIIDVVRAAPPQPAANPELPEPQDIAIGPVSDPEPAVRALIDQGRKVDAITLLQATRNLSFAQAAEQVGEMDSQIKAETERQMKAKA